MRRVSLGAWSAAAAAEPRPTRVRAARSHVARRRLPRDERAEVSRAARAAASAAPLRPLGRYLRQRRR